MMTRSVHQMSFDERSVHTVPGKVLVTDRMKARPVSRAASVLPTATVDAAVLCWLRPTRGWPCAVDAWLEIDQEELARCAVVSLRKQQSFSIRG